MEVKGTTLYVVATPIGNLEDITLRALTVLRGVSVVACEDTRHTRVLLNYHGMTTPVTSFHEHSPERTINMLLKRLLGADSVALVSDAGTPCLSDPGWRLVDACHREGVRVEVIPGPDAVVAALSVAGIPLAGYHFLGFVPHKKGRQTFLTKVLERDGISVFFESPHRVLKTLQWLRDHHLKGSVIVARELTKIHEEVVRGSIDDVCGDFEGRDRILGEFVVIIDRKEGARESCEDFHENSVF